jgi:hypothetical protein
MKNIFRTAIAMIALTMIFSACSTVKSLPAAATGASRARFVGTWTLSKIDYDGLLTGSVQNVFDQAPPNDFIGSTWKLTNSGNGIYTLQNGTSQTIFWSVNNNGVNKGQIFQFKKIYQGDKAKNVQEGYQLIVDAQDGKAMTVKSPIALDNKTAYIIYSFTKNP